MSGPALPDTPASAWTTTRPFRNLIIITSLMKLLVFGLLMLLASAAPRPWHDLLRLSILAVASFSIGRPIYLYFFRLKPAIRGTEAARKNFARLDAEEAASKARRDAASVAYHAASSDGQAFLAAMWDRAETSGQRQSVLKAWGDFNAAMTSNTDEPDLATRMTLQADSMRESIRITSMVNGSLAHP